MIYNKYNEDNEWAGITTQEDGCCTREPVKPVGPKDKAFFRNGNWEYEYEELRDVEEETPFLFSNFFPASFYCEEIYPENGETVLGKSQKISVLIPCFGKSMYVKDCVVSCLSQTMKPERIIVLAMDEESHGMKKTLEGLDGTVQVVCSERLDVCRARTKLVNELCPTEWFIFCDADDMLEEHCLEFLYKEPASVVYPSMSEISEQGERGNTLLPNEMPPFKNGHHSACLCLNMTALMNKEVFNEIGLDETLCNGGEDFDFNVRLLEKKKYKVSCLWDSWYYYRNTMGLSKKTSFFESHFMAVKKNLDFFHREYIRIKGYDAAEERFFKDPSLRNLNIFPDWHLLVSEKGLLLEAKRISSKRKTPICAYSPTGFVKVGDSDFDEDRFLGKIFDVFFLEAPTIKCFGEDIPMVINKKIWEEVRDLSGFQRIVFLLDNYACFDGGYSPFVEEWDECFSLIKNSRNKTKVLDEQLALLEVPPQKFEKKLSVEVTFSLHKGCNASCAYCNQGAIHKNTLTDEQMLDNFNKCLTLAEEKIGVFVPAIIGGEPTLWNDGFTKRVLERLEKYPLVKVFTNGTNQDSLWYKTDKVVIKKHVIDWEENPELLHRKGLKKNEIPVVVVTKQNMDKLEQVVTDPRAAVFVTPCYHASDKSYDLDEEDLTRLKKIVENNGLSHDMECLHGNSKEVDCETMTGLWCCKGDKRTPLNDWTKDKTMCERCFFH